MKTLKTVICEAALALCAIASAQPRSRVQAPITDGLKDTYK